MRASSSNDYVCLVPNIDALGNKAYFVENDTVEIWQRVEAIRGVLPLREYYYPIIKKDSGTYGIVYCSIDDAELWRMTNVTILATNCEYITSEEYLHERKKVELTLIDKYIEHDRWFSSPENRRVSIAIGYGNNNQPAPAGMSYKDRVRARRLAETDYSGPYGKDLKRQHENDGFLGYSDPDEWARDMIMLGRDPKTLQRMPAHKQ